MRLVCIVGIPGAGKSTALAGAIELLGWQETEVRETPVPHIRYLDPAGRTAVQIGRVRSEFGGTDALPLNVSPQACAFVASAPAPLVVAEGDRLAHRSFLDAARTVGPIQLVWLDLPPVVARERSLARAAELDRLPQSVSWVKGRVTKIDNLVACYPHHRVDATAPAPYVAAMVASYLRPEHEEEPAGQARLGE